MMHGVLQSIPYVLPAIHKRPFHFFVKFFCMDTESPSIPEDIIAITPPNCFFPVQKCNQTK